MMSACGSKVAARPSDTAQAAGPTSPQTPSCPPSPRQQTPLGREAPARRSGVAPVLARLWAQVASTQPRNLIRISCSSVAVVVGSLRSQSISRQPTCSRDSSESRGSPSARSFAAPLRNSATAPAGARPAPRPVATAPAIASSSGLGDRPSSNLPTSPGRCPRIRPRRPFQVRKQRLVQAWPALARPRQRVSSSSPQPHHRRTQPPAPGSGARSAALPAMSGNQ